MKRTIALLLTLLTVVAMFAGTVASADAPYATDAAAVADGMIMRIGAEATGTYYNNFQAAVNAASAQAKAGADVTVTIITDVEITAAINFGLADQTTGTHKVTYVGKGTTPKTTITFNTGSAVPFVGRNKTVEAHWGFENLKFVSASGMTCSTFFNLEGGTKDLTFKNCDFELEKSNTENTQYGLFFPRLAMTFDGCTIQSTTTCPVISTDRAAGVITLKNSVVSGAGLLVGVVNGSATITDVTYTSPTATGNSASVVSGTATVTNLTLKNPAIEALGKVITMVDGASIRCKAIDDSGIRFQSVVSKSALDAMDALVTAKTVKSYSFGTIVAKAADVTGEFTAAAVASAIDTPAVDGIRDGEEGAKIVSVAMINVKKSHYETDFAARAYVDFKMNDDSTLRVYADFDADKNVRNIAEVAAAALADVKNAAEGDYTNEIEAGKFSRYSANQIAVIEAYLPN